MGNNMFVSFEFNRPERAYDRAALAIKSMDESCVEVQFAHWHVNTPLSARKVCDQLKPVLDERDKLIVVDATNNEAAWINLDENADRGLRDQGC